MKLILTCMLHSLLVYNAEASEIKKIDSLRTQLRKQNLTDTLRVIILNELSFEYRRRIPDSAKACAHRALYISKEINYQRGIANSFYHLGTIAWNQSDNKLAISCLEQSLKIMEELKDLKGICNASGNIGNIHYSQGNYLKALKTYQKTIEIQKKMGDMKRVGISYNNIGMVYQSIGEYSEALKYYLKALNAKEDSGLSEKLSKTYINIGIVKSYFGQLEEAKTYFKKSLHYNRLFGDRMGLAEDYLQLGMVQLRTDSLNAAISNFKKSTEVNTGLGNFHGVARGLNKIGLVYLAWNDPDAAINYFDQSLVIRDSINDNDGRTQVFYNLAKAYSDKNEPKLTLKHALSGFNLAKELGIKKEVSEISKLLYLTYMNISDKDNALKYLLIHKSYSDSIINESTLKDMANIETRNEIEKLNDRNKLLVKENELKISQLDEQKGLLLISIFVLVAISIITYLIYKQYLIKNRAHTYQRALNYRIIGQKNEIERQTQLLAEVNENQEREIQERTSKIQMQNNRLKEYAYSISHNVRAPLSRLMGLVNLLVEMESISDEHGKINKMIIDSADELDLIIRKLNAGLDK